MQVTIGRLDGNSLVIKDEQVSGSHLQLAWSPQDRCWTARDTGSLNGTMLNGRIISTSNRSKGRPQHLSSDDILELGSFSKLKVTSPPSPESD